MLLPIVIVAHVAAAYASVSQTTNFVCPTSPFSILEDIQVVFVGPTAEELMFTGFLLTLARRRFDGFVATAFVAVVFSVMHLPGDLDLFWARFVFMSASCVLFIQTDRLWPSILMHVLGNATLSTMGRTGAMCEVIQLIPVSPFVTSLGFALVTTSILAWLAKRKA